MKIRIKQISATQVWPLRHRVMYPDLSFEAIKLEHDHKGIHFGLYAAEHLVSVVSLFRSGNVFQFRKFATETRDQGKGYGSLLLNHIIQFAGEAGAEKLWCNARISAAGFYSKFGFETTDIRSTSNDIDFVIMEYLYLSE